MNLSAFFRMMAFERANKTLYDENFLGNGSMDLKCEEFLMNLGYWLVQVTSCILIIQTIRFVGF